MNDFEFITESIRISGDDRVDFDSQTCGCKPKKEGDVTCLDNRCMNYVTQIECGRCGPTCGNKRLTNKQYADLEIRDTPPKGQGIFAKHPISNGALVGEYLGEIINAKELERRVADVNDSGAQHMYVMALQGKSFVDSRFKGSMIRFMNHSCEPNCTLERWTVRGRMRLAIFATRDIAAGEEITVDYNWRLSGRPPTRCYCRTPSCRGFLEVFNSDEITAMLSRRGVWVSCRERFVSNGMKSTPGNSETTESNGTTSSNSIFNRDGTINSTNIVGRYLKVYYEDTKQFSETRVEKYLGKGKYALFDIIRHYSYEEDGLERSDANWYYLDESVGASIGKKRSSAAINGEDEEEEEDWSGFPVIATPVQTTTIQSSSQKRSRPDNLENPDTAPTVTQTFRVRYKLAAQMVHGDWKLALNGSQIDYLLDETVGVPTLVEEFLGHIKSMYNLRGARRVVENPLSDKKHPYSFELEVQAEASVIQQLKRALYTTHEEQTRLEEECILQKRKAMDSRQAWSMIHDWRMRPIIGTTSCHVGHCLVRGALPLFFTLGVLETEGIDVFVAKLLTVWMQTALQSNPSTFRADRTFGRSVNRLPQLLLPSAATSLFATATSASIDDPSAATSSSITSLGGLKAFDISTELDRDLMNLLYSMLTGGTSSPSAVSSVGITAMVLWSRYLQANSLDERQIARERVQLLSAFIIVAQQIHSYPRFAGYVSAQVAPAIASAVFKPKSIKKLVRYAMAQVQHRDIEEISAATVDAVLPMVLEKCEACVFLALRGDLFVSDIFTAYAMHALFSVSPPVDKKNSGEDEDAHYETRKREFKQQSALWPMWQRLVDDVHQFLWWLRYRTGPSFFAAVSWDELQLAALLLVYTLQRVVTETEQTDTTAGPSRRVLDFHSLIEKFVVLSWKRWPALMSVSYAGMAQSLQLLIQTLAAVTIAESILTSETSQTGDKAIPKPSVVDRVVSFMHNFKDSVSAFVSVDKREFAAQQLRLKVESASSQYLKTLLEQHFTRDIANFHHLPPHKVNAAHPVHLKPLAEAIPAAVSPLLADSSVWTDTGDAKDPKTLKLHPVTALAITTTVSSEATPGGLTSNARRLMTVDGVASLPDDAVTVPLHSCSSVTKVSLSV